MVDLAEFKTNIYPLRHSTSLLPHYHFTLDKDYINKFYGGSCWARTSDLTNVNRTL